MEHLTILGPPRTKKTSQRIMRVGRKPRLLPSAAHQRWFESAILQVRKQRRGVRYIWVGPVSVRAIVYRDRDVGDLLNYLQAVADLLERGRCVLNDRQIQSWDGSRLDIDYDRPRIEIGIEALNGG